MKKRLIVMSGCIIILWSVLFFTGCGGGSGMNPQILEGKPDEFYESVRLIMLRDEMKRYRQLPDKEAREVFITEFWNRRDPNPATPENEFKLEFDERIKYIERWFGESVGYSGGVNSDRGKVFLIFGAPDEKSTSERTEMDRYGSQVNVRREIWIYDRHRLYLEFRDTQGFGVYRLPFWSPELLTAIELEKDAIAQGESPDAPKKSPFEFKARFIPKEQEIEFSVPVRGVTFEEKKGRMTAAFKFTCRLSRDEKDLEPTETQLDVSYTPEELLKMEQVMLRIPCKLPGPGLYRLDILAKDLGSGERYRGGLKFDIRSR